MVLYLFMVFIEEKFLGKWHLVDSLIPKAGILRKQNYCLTKRYLKLSI